MRVDGGTGPRTAQLGVWNSSHLRVVIDRGDARYGPSYPRAGSGLEDDWDRMAPFYDFCGGHVYEMKGGKDDVVCRAHG